MEGIVILILAFLCFVFFALWKRSQENLKKVMEEKRFQSILPQERGDLIETKYPVKELIVERYYSDTMPEIKKPIKQFIAKDIGNKLLKENFIKFTEKPANTQDYDLPNSILTGEIMIVDKRENNTN